MKTVLFHGCAPTVAILITISILQSRINTADATKSLLRRVAAPLPIRKDERKQIKTFEKWTELVTTEQDITPYISHILNERMDQVMSGYRTKSFATYHKKQVDSVDDKNRADEVKQALVKGPALLDAAGLAKMKTCKDAYFPQDVTSLDLTFTPDMYAMATKEIRTRIRSESKDDYEKYIREILYVPKLFLRAIKLGINFTPVTMTCGIAAVSQTFRERFWYSMLGSCLARSGPAFIKWGQWASTRSDMFPDTLCSALTELHADAPAHSWKITKRTVEEALCIPKGRLLEVFQSFEREPVASGSIAQIHRAVIRPSGAAACESKNLFEKVYGGLKDGDVGQLVAIKVRHPKVARLIDMDFRIMGILASIIDHLPGLGWLRIRSSIDQFSHTMAAQAHLNVEAHHLEVLNYNFRKWDGVGFPKPLFACPSVIIETFENGKICSNIFDRYDRLAAEVGLTASEIIPIPLAEFVVTTGLGLYLKMLIIDNLMHADLHPGNIMVLAELFDKCDAISSMLHSEDPTPQHAMKMARAELAYGFYGHITLVDAGMVAQLAEQDSANFIGLMSSLGAGDGRTAAESVLKFSNEVGYLTKEEEAAFTQEMISFFEERCRGYGTNTDVGEVLRGVLGIIKNHRVRIDANYATLVVNALCIEGLAKRVCPAYNVLDAAKPLLSSYRALPNFISKNRVLKKFVLDYVTPILYMQKNRFDKTFFKNLEEKRRSNSSLRKLSQQISKLVIACASAGVVIKLLESEDGISLDFDALQKACILLLGLFANRKKDLMKSEEKEERKGLSLNSLKTMFV